MASQIDGVIDLVVVGAGLAGLISARDFLITNRDDQSAPKANVLIIEARDRIGGQIYSTTPPDSPTLELGAEWINEEVHPSIKEELDRYDIQLTKNSADKNHASTTYWFFKDKLDLVDSDVNVFSSKDLISKLNNSDIYKEAIEYIDTDAQYVNLDIGFWQPERDYLDSSVPEYIDIVMANISQITLDKYSKTDYILVKEYLLAQAFSLSGIYASRTNSSTIAMLTMIARWQGARRAFDRSSEQIVNNQYGMSELPNRIMNEIDVLGGEIKMEKSIVSITLTKRLRENPDLPNYDYADDMMSEDSILELMSIDGQKFLARGVIVAIPTRCYPSLNIQPGLPDIIPKAIYHCNASEDYIKSFLKTENLSSNVSRIIAPSTVCKESKTQKSIIDGETATTVSVCGDRHDILKGPSKIIKDLYPDLTLISFFSNIDQENPKPLYHDFVADPNTRSSWFSLRPGTGKLHHDASKAFLDYPWARINEKCLVIASAEFSAVWPGWLEAAVLVARNAAQNIYPYLFRSPIARNLLKKKPVPDTFYK